MRNRAYLAAVAFLIVLLPVMWGVTSVLFFRVPDVTTLLPQEAVAYVVQNHITTFLNAIKEAEINLNEIVGETLPEGLEFLRDENWREYGFDPKKPMAQKITSLEEKSG